MGRPGLRAGDQEGAGHYQFEVRSLEGRGEFVVSMLEVGVEGLSSGVRTTTTAFHVMRWDGDRLIELHSYFDADEARREYERLSSV